MSTLTSTTANPSPGIAAGRRRRGSAGGHVPIALIVAYAVLIVLAATMLVPYSYLVVNAFKPAAYFYQFPYNLIPAQATLSNFRDVLTYGKVGVFLRNSFLYAIVVLVVQLAVDALAAYAFARLTFRGRDALFVALLATLMLPFSVLLIPTYLIVYSVGLANTIPGVVLPGFASAFGIFLLRQFFLTIPHELEDAARVDGAGSFRIFGQIILPLAQPALITLGVLIFIEQYSSYIWPLVVLSNDQLYPISVGIALFRSESLIQWPQIFAASTLASLPLIAIFLSAQRFLIGGISLSGLKG
jgi:multiple sugar transport system permease protein